MRIQQTIDFGYPEGYIYDGYRYVEGGESYLTPEGPVLVFLGTRSLVPCIALKKVKPFIWPEIIKPGTWGGKRMMKKLVGIVGCNLIFVDNTP